MFSIQQLWSLLWNKIRNFLQAEAQAAGGMWSLSEANGALL